MRGRTQFTREFIWTAATVLFAQVRTGFFDAYCNENFYPRAKNHPRTIISNVLPAVNCPSPRNLVRHVYVSVCLRLPEDGRSLHLVCDPIDITQFKIVQFSQTVQTDGYNCGVICLKVIRIHNTPNIMLYIRQQK